MPGILLPALLPPEGDLNSASLSPGKQVKESPSASSSPERLPEDLSSHTNPGDVSREDVSMLSSSDDLGEASVVSSPEKQPADTVNPRFESGTVFQQNKKVMRRLKSEVWHHFSLAPMDSLKAVCQYCSCVISRRKKGDVGTSCLMRHLYRRHPEVVGNQKDFLGASLANSPYVTLASAKSSSKLTDLPAVVRKKHQGVFPTNSKKTSLERKKSKYHFLQMI